MITAIFTAHKNRDLTHVIFNKPVYMVSEKGKDLTGPEAHGAASTDRTYLKTSIEIINASNHNRGYYDYQIYIITGKRKIYLNNKHNNSSGNLGERSHHTLIYEGECNEYFDTETDFKVIITVKLVKRRLLPFFMYKVKRKSIKRVLWGSAPDHVLK